MPCKSYKKAFVIGGSRQQQANMAFRANRLTQMDGEVPLILPAKVARERVSKQVPRSASTQAQVRGLKLEHHAFWSKSPLAPHGKIDVTKANYFTKMVQDKSRTSYHEFMHLDQAGPAIIAQDNMNRREFVAIKRIKRIASTPVYTVPAFESNQIVNIKEMFLEGDNLITVVYEQMDVSLRHIMAVKGGPLEAFEIAAICQDVSTYLSLFNQYLTGKNR